MLTKKKLFAKELDMMSDLFRRYSSAMDTMAKDDSVSVETMVDVAREFEYMASSIKWGFDSLMNEIDKKENEDEE